MVSAKSGEWPARGDAECVGTRRAASLPTSTGQVGAHGRLATGEPQPVDLEPLDEDPRQALDLLERQHLAARHPHHALFRHAVGAAEVAAVGDRNAQVTNGASKGIDEIHVGQAIDSSIVATEPPGSMPSPSGTMANASASEVAANWWLPWAPTEATW